MGHLVITRKQYADGFEYIEVCNDAARAKIALQGAHLFHYERRDALPLLWVSGASAFKEGEAIRGGVPLCWPWFGRHMSDPSLPQHGFARTAMFECFDVREDANGSTLCFRLCSTPQTLQQFPYAFELHYRVHIGVTLRMELQTYNTGDAPFEVTQALHTYIALSDIGNIHVNGLEGKPYLDALTQELRFQNGAIRIDQEVDRIYYEVDEAIEVVDAARRICIESGGSASAVVWNPWIAKCARMSAMEPEGYKTMLCVESANACDDARVIAPGHSHTLRALICTTH